MNLLKKYFLGFLLLNFAACSTAQESRSAPEYELLIQIPNEQNKTENPLIDLIGRHEGLELQHNVENEGLSYQLFNLTKKAGLFIYSGNVSAGDALRCHIDPSKIETHSGFYTVNLDACSWPDSYSLIIVPQFTLTGSGPYPTYASALISLLHHVPPSTTIEMSSMRMIRTDKQSFEESIRDISKAKPSSS